MKRVIIALTFLCFGIGIQAQTSSKALNDILQQPSVRLLGQQERTINFRTDIDSNNATLLKYFPATAERLEDYQQNYLAYQMIDLILNEERKLYRDAEMQEVLSREEVKKMQEVNRDTIITFDPETFEEYFKIVIDLLSDSKSYFAADMTFKVKEYLCYDEAKGMLYSYPVAMAPIRKIYNWEGEFLMSKLLFWIPINVVDKVNEGTPAYSWIAEIEEDVNFNKINPSALSNIYTDIKGRVLSQSLPIWETLSAEKIVSEDLETYFQTEKSFVDPALFQELVELVDFAPEDCTSVKFFHKWAWNQETKSFTVQQLGFALLPKFVIKN